MDELCVCFSPGLWLWVALSRLVGHVLAFALDDRSREALAVLWDEVPADYRSLPVFTDWYGVYGSFFRERGGVDHRPCDKGSGLTNVAEGNNTKWRQRQSGLVRRSCGVGWRIADDIYERFLILLERHNRERIARWERRLFHAAIQANP